MNYFFTGSSLTSLINFSVKAFMIFPDDEGEQLCVYTGIYGSFNVKLFPEYVSTLQQFTGITPIAKPALTLAEQCKDATTCRASTCFQNLGLCRDVNICPNKGRPTTVRVCERASKVCLVRNGVNYSVEVKKICSRNKVMDVFSRRCYPRRLRKPFIEIIVTPFVTILRFIS